jgi:hypothetical protein
MKSVIQFFFFWGLLGSAAAQPGCPDPQANNYDPSATSNDGSCLYPLTSYTPALKALLPNKLNEISGMTFGGGRWWGHADSGNADEFYQINPDIGTILQTVKMDNAKNRDWEDMTADDTYLYIGDFGNNSNNRKNLGIYTVPLALIGSGSSVQIEEFQWGFLPFSYMDQTDFSAQPEDSSVYDCEAMIVYGGQIHLFTKSRKYHNTSHYIVNTSSNVAEKIETFNTEGTITGASLSPDGKLIALVGYDLRPTVPTVFCWLLWDWQPGSSLFFSGNKRRIELGTALQVGQVESVAFSGNRNGYISNEKVSVGGITVVQPTVRLFDFSQWVSSSSSLQEPVAGGLRLFPNPFSHSATLEADNAATPTDVRVFDMLGQAVLRAPYQPGPMALGSLPAGTYVFELWEEGRVLGRQMGVKWH